jgi:GT2 family glycosyltransferase
VRALREGHFPAEAQLPHYCADYEYTNRLRRAGYAPVLFTGSHAALVEENTGFDTFLASTSLWSRLARAWDIKCPYNLRYRYRFVRLVYPAAAVIPGLCSHFAKIFLEIAFGGRKLRRLRKN